MLSRRQFLVASAAAALAPYGFAQEPLDQVSIVVGFPAGGGTDLVARLIAEGLRHGYARTVIVENRPGASGRIAADYVKTAKNDGSVLFFTPAFVMLISPHLYKLKYDPLRDFTPIGIGARSMLCLAVGPAMPTEVKTIADLVKWARANPKKSAFGAPPGSGQHFAGQLFGRAAGIEFNQIPYKGGAPAMQDLLGGHIPANVSPVSEALPHHLAGKIRILAVTGAKRTRFLPGVPTMRELGYRDVLFQDWLGMFAPAGVPAAVADRANAAMAGAFKSEQSLAALGKLGVELETVTPQAFAAIFKEDYERYRGIVQASGFKPEQ